MVTTLKSLINKTQTIGDFISECLSIDNERDAKAFFKNQKAYVQHQIDERTWESKNNAEEATRMNIGFCFGEGMAPERIAMWKKATGAAHPWLPYL